MGIAKFLDETGQPQNFLVQFRATWLFVTGNHGNERHAGEKYFPVSPLHHSPHHQN